MNRLHVIVIAVLITGLCLAGSVAGTSDSNNENPIYAYLIQLGSVYSSAGHVVTPENTGGGTFYPGVARYNVQEMSLPGKINAPGTVTASFFGNTHPSSLTYQCDGIDDQVEIQSALDSVPGEGGRVALSEGTFNCTEGLSIKGNTIFTGQGIDRTILHFLSKGSDIVLGGTGNITTGGYTITGSGGIRVSSSDCLVTNVRAYGIDNSQLAAFTVYKWNSPVENVTFSQCSAVDTDSWGFLVDGEGKVHTVRDLKFLSCQAINCGKYGQFYGTNPPQDEAWNVGFSIAENADVQDVLLKDCLAEGCWESGFHAEFLRKIQNVTLVNCTSRDNGQKEKTGWGKASYGAGFVVSNDMKLENCVSEDNIVGYLCKPGGSTITDCSDSGSETGASIKDITTKGGLKISECSFTDENSGIIISSSGVPISPVAIDNSIITRNIPAGTSSGLIIQRDVPNPELINIRNSRISGFYTGIRNRADGYMRASNVSIYDATVYYTSDR